MNEFNIRDGLIVFDRGISSKQNQKDIQGLTWKAVCGLPIIDALKEFLRPIILKNKFLDYESRVRLNKTVFYLLLSLLKIHFKKNDISPIEALNQSASTHKRRYNGRGTHR